MKGWFDCDVCRGSGIEEVYGGHGTVLEHKCNKVPPMETELFQLSTMRNAFLVFAKDDDNTCLGMISREAADFCWFGSRHRAVLYWQTDIDSTVYPTRGEAITALIHEHVKEKLCERHRRTKQAIEG